MALDWENIVDYSHHIYPFDNNNVTFMSSERLTPRQSNDDIYPFENHSKLLFPLEKDQLFCFDNASPIIFDIDEILVDPNSQQLNHHDQHCNHNDDLITSNTYDDFAPPMFLPTEEIFPCEEDYYFSQFLPCPKRQKLTLPCFNEFVPEPTWLPQWRNSDNCYQLHHYDGVNNNNNNNNNNNSNYDDGNGGVKEKSVSAQSKAARERRKKIRMKTEELGKLVPGGTKMNTAEMFQAAFKYVKFLQAQVGILQSMKTMNEEGEKMISPKNLSILGSDAVQEKLYAKEKCLVPLDLLPLIKEQHPDFETNLIHYSSN